MEQARCRMTTQLSIVVLGFVLLGVTALSRFPSVVSLSTLMGGIGPVVELIGLGAGLGVLGLLGALLSGSHPRPVPLPVRTDRRPPARAPKKQ